MPHADAEQIQLRPSVAQESNACRVADTAERQMPEAVANGTASSIEDAVGGYLSPSLDNEAEMAIFVPAERAHSIAGSDTDAHGHAMSAPSDLAEEQQEGQEEQEDDNDVDGDNERGDGDDDDGGHLPHLIVSMNEESGSSSRGRKSCGGPSPGLISSDQPVPLAPPTPTTTNVVTSPAISLLSDGTEEARQHDNGAILYEGSTASSARSDPPSPCDETLYPHPEGPVLQSTIVSSSPPRQTASISSPTSEVPSPLRNGATVASRASSSPVSPPRTPPRPLPVQVEEVLETPRAVSPASSAKSASCMSQNELSPASTVSFAEHAPSSDAFTGREVSPTIPTSASVRSGTVEMEASKVGVQPSDRSAADKQKYQRPPSPDSTPAEEVADVSPAAGASVEVDVSTNGYDAVDMREVPESQSNLAESSQNERQTPELHPDVDDSGDDADLSSPLHGKGKRHNVRTRKASSKPTPPKPARGRLSAGKQSGDTSGLRGSARAEDSIRRSYTDFGFDGYALKVSYDQKERHPTTLTLTLANASQSVLNHKWMEKMHRARDELLTYLPIPTEGGPEKVDLDLVRRLSQKHLAPLQQCSFVEVAAACERRTRLSKDEVNLWQFLQSLALVAASRHTPDDVRTFETYVIHEALMLYSSNKPSRAGARKSELSCTRTNVSTSRCSI